MQWDSVCLVVIQLIRSKKLYLRLDHRSGEPIYRQVVEQVKYKVACSDLSPGDQLPSIRALAGQLKINPRTVVKAYEELRRGGLVVMKQGQGVFVTDNENAVPFEIRRKTIAEIARRMLSEAARMGAGADEVVAIMKAEIERMETKSDEE